MKLSGQLVAYLSLAGMLWLVMPSAVTGQQDTVITRSESGKTAKRRGVISSWKGNFLSLTSGSRTRDIDNERIVRIETVWNSQYQSGIQFLERGKHEQAAIALRAAIGEENRPWAKVIIQAELVRALTVLDQNAEAIEVFARIIAVDPQTRFLSRIPLPWTGSVGNARVQIVAKKCRASRDPALQLIGASWMAGGPERSESLQLLEKLSNDFEPAIANLAVAQLWKSNVTGATELAISKWEQKLKQMPPELRAGPYYTLAMAQARLNQPLKAKINLMRIPILYPKQDALAAAALYKCANLLQNAGSKSEARTLRNELLADFPESTWAKQIDSTASGSD